MPTDQVITRRKWQMGGLSPDDVDYDWWREPSLRTPTFRTVLEIDYALFSMGNEFHSFTPTEFFNMGTSEELRLPSAVRFSSVTHTNMRRCNATTPISRRECVSS